MPPAMSVQHPLFRTADLDQAREAVAAVFCPHPLELEGRDRSLRALHNLARLDRVSLNYLDYGAGGAHRAGELDSFFLALSRPIRSDLEMDLTSPAGSGWLALVRLLVGEVDRGDGAAAAGHRPRRGRVADLAAAHPAAQLLRGVARRPAARAAEGHPARDEAHRIQARTAADHRGHRPPGRGQRADAAGRLPERGRLPDAYLRDVLQRVHEQLRNSDPVRAAYRAKFGESPSQLRGR